MLLPLFAGRGYPETRGCLLVAGARPACIESTVVNAAMGSSRPMRPPEASAQGIDRWLRAAVLLRGPAACGNCRYEELGEPRHVGAYRKGRNGSARPSVNTG